MTPPAQQRITEMQGSLMNRIAENSTPAVPVVGMGATQIMYSDRHAFTVIAVAANGKSCTVQADTATRTDGNGMSDSQAYTFAPNPEGATYDLRLNKKGQWAVKGSPGQIFGMGYRSEYHDFSF